jgi:hypothetical protein
MVKVTFKPWDEVVIHEAIYHSFTELVTICSVGAQPGGLQAPLQWAEGVVFRSQSMPFTDEVAKELIQGKVHWLAVDWALMPEYQNVIPIRDINAKIPVINVASTAILCDVAKALKEQVKK